LIGDEKKTAPLKELPGAVERLVLFEADMYDADTFEPAIAGCEFVFLLATPLHHDPRSTKVHTAASLECYHGKDEIITYQIFFTWAIATSLMP
jgi:hypothetical protein